MRGRTRSRKFRVIPACIGVLFAAAAVHIYSIIYRAPIGKIRQKAGAAAQNDPLESICLDLMNNETERGISLVWDENEKGSDAFMPISRIRQRKECAELLYRTRRGKVLIWFQHFHKAGGTSLVQLASRNGARFARQHVNGNPHRQPHAGWNPFRAANKLIDFWLWPRSAQRQWSLALLSAGTDFIASEFGFPAASRLLPPLPTLYIATLRHPVDRLVSEYIWHSAAARAPVAPITDATWRARTQGPNYYVRVLTGQPWDQCTAASARDAAPAPALALAEHDPDAGWCFPLAGSGGSGWQPLEGGLLRFDPSRPVTAADLAAAEERLRLFSVVVITELTATDGARDWRASVYADRHEQREEQSLGG
jgi:hypothetical protein